MANITNLSFDIYQTINDFLPYRDIYKYLHIIKCEKFCIKEFTRLVDEKLLLFPSAETNSTYILNFFIKKYNIDINHVCTDFFGSSETVLIKACREGKYEIVKELLKYPEIDVNFLGDDLQWYGDGQSSSRREHPLIHKINSALMTACRHRNLKIVQELLKHPEIDINLQEQVCYHDFFNYLPNPHGDTALTAAIRNNAFDIAKFLINSTVNVNVLTADDIYDDMHCYASSAIGLLMEKTNTPNQSIDMSDCEYVYKIDMKLVNELIDILVARSDIDVNVNHGKPGRGLLYWSEKYFPKVFEKLKTAKSFNPKLVEYYD